jgi:hypothetical protein
MLFVSIMLGLFVLCVCDRCDDVEKLYPVIKDLARLYR